MSKEKITIWGRDFQLSTYLECYPGENILESQDKALRWILSAPSAISIAKQKVENHLVSNNPEEFSTGSIDNIFKYVMPKSIFVPHNQNHSIIAIMCDYKFDEEHGLAIVFEDENYKALGSQDIVL